jgi:hypothetical protein
MARPRVEFLWWAECPSWERALGELRDAMSAAGLDPESIEMKRIESDEDAERESFPGSPTIRVEGSDVEPPDEGEPAGLVCRVYRRPGGRVSPLPDPDNVRAALDRAAGRST